MTRNTYYIDPVAGDDTHDGLSPSWPLRSYATREFCPGDSVLFKRGSVIRDRLHTRQGTDQAPLTYGAYGEGDKPTFLGSISVGQHDQWVEERPSIWRYTGALPSEACNLIFNNGAGCGTLRWQMEDLRQAGDWHYTAFGRSSQAESGEIEADAKPVADAGVLYLYSPSHPARAYSRIECALWGQRKLVDGQRCLVLENLSFQNAGVHGYQEFHARQVVIRDCEFRFIGGAVWNRQRRIRFGNAIEFWDGAQDIEVQRCLFENIYDSGVTHQGGQTRNIPQRLHFHHNRFVNCGMAAYECREPSREVYFEHNTCLQNGGGFGLQGEAPPRQSEVYPSPMGHHVFLWRIDPLTQPGHVYIRHNLFGPAPEGAAIYSLIDPADERQLILDHNQYEQPSDQLLIHWSGCSYRLAEFARYQARSGQDAHSQAAEPRGGV